MTSKLAFREAIGQFGRLHLIEKLVSVRKKLEKTGVSSFFSRE
jgi:hypothetical protein